MESRAVDVLRVVVLSGVVRPAEVELVCLAACNACRESSADYAVVIRAENARLVSLSRKEEGEASSLSSSGSSNNNNNNNDNNNNTDNGGSCNSTGSPPCAPVKACSRITPHHRIYRVAFRVNLPFSQIAWPEGLRVLKLGWAFDHPLNRPLPQSLVDLDLGDAFNHHIEEVAWPTQLARLRFGDRFNRQIELAAWPATLKVLSFGSSFDQPIESVEWPRALETLSLGDAFNHPVQSVKWAIATGLKKLEFGMAFRHAVDDVAWPPALTELKFGACFDQQLEAWELPRSLRLLRLPDVYAMHDTFEPDGLPQGCRLCIDRTEMFDLYWQ
ncbi:unnamed protein product [Pylaiella littoralis]